MGRVARREEWEVGKRISADRLERRYQTALAAFTAFDVGSTLWPSADQAAQIAPAVRQFAHRHSRLLGHLLAGANATERLVECPGRDVLAQHPQGRSRPALVQEVAA